MKKKLTLILAIIGITATSALILSKSPAQEVQRKTFQAESLNQNPTVESPRETITAEKEREILKEEISSARLSIAAIRNYSQKIYLSSDEKVALKSNLMNEATRAAIKEHLTNPFYLQDNQFTQRIHALDALYEGLKFNDSDVREAYLGLVVQTLSLEPSVDVLNNKKLLEQFYGDRVEVALILQKMEGSLAHTVQMQTQPISDRYFQRAKEISSTYQVAL